MVVYGCVCVWLYVHVCMCMLVCVRVHVFVYMECVCVLNTCIVSIKQCTFITLSLQPYSFLLQEAAENPHWIAPAYKEYVATIQILYVLHVALASLMLNVCNDWNSAMVL